MRFENRFRYTEIRKKKKKKLHELDGRTPERINNTHCSETTILMIK